MIGADYTEQPSLFHKILNLSYFIVDIYSCIGLHLFNDEELLTVLHR